MAIDAVTCVNCGKLFVPMYGNRLCRQCTEQHQEKMARIEEAVYRRDKRTVEEIAEDAGLAVAEVRRLVEGSFLLSHSVQPADMCAKCRKKLAQPGSRFCLACRLELHKALGDAAAELSEGLVYEPQYPPQRSTGLLSAFDDKRERANTTIVGRTRQRLK